MAEHVREQIMQSIHASLSNIPGLEGNVVRNFEYAHPSEHLPSLNIREGTDDPTLDDSDSAMINYIDWTLTVILEIRVKGMWNIYTETNRISAEITKILMADLTQGVAGCYHTMQGTVMQPESSPVGDQPAVKRDIEYQFRYRVDRLDPTRGI